jgi:hypothetical protein
MARKQQTIANETGPGGAGARWKRPSSRPATIKIAIKLQFAHIR